MNTGTILEIVIPFTATAIAVLLYKVLSKRRKQSAALLDTPLTTGLPRPYDQADRIIQKAPGRTACGGAQKAPGRSGNGGTGGATNTSTSSDTYVVNMTSGFDHSTTTNYVAHHISYHHRSHSHDHGGYSGGDSGGGGGGGCD